MLPGALFRCSALELQMVYYITASAAPGDIVHVRLVPAGVQFARGPCTGSLVTVSKEWLMSVYILSAGEACSCHIYHIFLRPEWLHLGK